MNTTVIIASYNKPGYLKLVLDGYRNQTQTAFEIIVADDGSTSETKALMQQEQADYPFPLQHIWQADQGFRKCRILNKAVAMAQGSAYLIFTDDDCIPLPDFIESHLKHARKGHFLSSGGMRLPESLTQYILARGYDDIDFCFKWLNRHGLPDRIKYKRFYWTDWQRVLLDILLPIKKTFNGNNSSAFRDDIIKVGGFDERMQYHGEDVELGYRLKNSGIRPLRARHRVRAIHLEHGRGYVTDEMIERNIKIIADTVSANKTYNSHHVEFT